MQRDRVLGIHPGRSACRKIHAQPAYPLASCKMRARGAVRGATQIKPSGGSTLVEHCTTRNTFEAKLCGSPAAEWAPAAQNCDSVTPALMMPVDEVPPVMTLP
mmetsp:Transcript_38274/g.77034  ORF Transcript_38274/g.77034 Transcript_38274/m.77034 type:complete len:103 (+) Transcript_38274:196-504(+)